MAGEAKDDRGLISVAEYARRNGLKRNTVAYWCNRDLLPGAIKVPAVRGSFCGYKYMIPQDARPERYATEAKKEAEAKGMVSTGEYARQAGVKAKTVLKWCQIGWLQGVEKVQRGNGYQYMIPRDAKPKKTYNPKMARQKKPAETAQPEPPRPPKVWTEREINLHIRRYCGTRTYQQLSQDTGLSVEEIRRRYERLHRTYGV